MPVTYKKIASVTVTGATAANIEFTSIPADYTDLILFTSTRLNNTGLGVAVTFNNSSTGLSTRGLYGDGSSATSYSGSTPLGAISNNSSYTANTFSNTMLYIPNYTGSTNKSSSMDGVSENNATAAYQFMNANLWSNTSAITSIKLTPETAGHSFVTHSSATLYGIKKN